MKNTIKTLVISLFLSSPLFAQQTIPPTEVKMDCKPLKEMGDFQFVSYQDRTWSFKHKTSGVALAINCQALAPKDMKKFRADLDKVGKTTKLMDNQFQVESEAAGLSTVTFYNIGDRVQQYSLTADKNQKEDFTKLSKSILNDLRSNRK